MAASGETKTTEFTESSEMFETSDFLVNVGTATRRATVTVARTILNAADQDFTGDVTADSFAGDGSALTNIVSTGVGGASSTGSLSMIANSAGGSPTATHSFINDGVEFGSFEANGDFLVDTDGIVYDRSTGFIGLGVLPTSMLHVQENDASVTASSNSDTLVVEKSLLSGLSVIGSDSSNQSIYLGSPASVSGTQIIWDSDGDTNGLLSMGTNKASAQLAFKTGLAVEQLRIDSTGNIGIGTTDFGSGSGGVIGIVNASAPSATPTGGGVLYVESGALKYKGSSGTVTTLGSA